LQSLLREDLGIRIQSERMHKAGKRYAFARDKK
jgi:hypothetical protein